MKILALDFSTLRRSAAVVDENGNVLSSVTQEVQRAGSPFPLISEALALASLAPEQIEGIAVGLGPGSYTGIRSSLAIAQGWNLAREIPAAGVSSAEAIAFGAFEKGLRGSAEVVIDAQRGEVYSALYNLTDFSLLRPLKILPQPETRILIGPEAKRWSEEGIVIEPSAAIIGRLASREKNFGPPERLEAIYLREASFVKAPAVRHA
jgi:tRNA threonylcarbamoyl adenosine modification protein YeaZ